VFFDKIFNTFESVFKLSKMKFYLVLFSIFLFNISSFGQLDPFYLGTYTNEAKTESYTINFIPEEGIEAKDCFLFSFNKMSNGKNVSVTKGVGYCESETEHIELRLENSTTPLEVDFEIDSKGAKLMTVHFNDGKLGRYTELIEIIENDLSFADKIYARKDGSEMLISHNYNGEGFLFTIYGKTTDKCILNEISGTVTPLNSEKTLFEYKVGAGRIVFNVSAKNIILTEENSVNPNGASCVTWAGEYMLK
jgi:hypothetical protein